MLILVLFDRFLRNNFGAFPLGGKGGGAPGQRANQRLFWMKDFMEEQLCITLCLHKLSSLTQVVAELSQMLHAGWSQTLPAFYSLFPPDFLLTNVVFFVCHKNTKFSIEVVTWRQMN